MKSKNGVPVQCDEGETWQLGGFPRKRMLQHSNQPCNEVSCELNHDSSADLGSADFLSKGATARTNPVPTGPGCGPADSVAKSLSLPAHVT